MKSAARTPLAPSSRRTVFRGFVLFAATTLMAGCNAPMAGRTDLAAPEPTAEAAVAAEAAVITPAPGPSPSPARTAPRRGVVTAGDIDDALNLAAFGRYQSRMARAQGLTGMNLDTAVLAQLTGPDGKPAAGVPITLRRPGAAEPFYSGYSGVDGRVAVFPAALGRGTPRRVELRAFGTGQDKVSHTLATGTQQQLSVPFNEGWAPDFMDLVFVFDTTGSMGDELAWLTREFAGIVRTARRSAPGADIRFGLVAYRDRGDAYVVRNFGFTNQQSQMQGWLRSLDAIGGGDYPEAAAEALNAAANLNWRRGKGERLLFHVADAPPHKSQARSYQIAARRLAGKNVQIFGLGASGVAEESELLMRQAALVTNGRYLFLTDDSGVGQPHAEPNIACYRVTSLKSLLSRVLVSELTGKRREARQNEIIREVGTYRRGVCQQ